MLRQIGMHLNLKHGGFDRSLVEHLSNSLSGDVAEANVSGETFALETLHSRPCLHVRDSCVENHPRYTAIHGWVVIDPLGRIQFFNWNEL